MKRHFSRTLRTAVLCLLPTLAACSDTPDAPVASDDAPRVQLVVETTIGGIDEQRPEYEFGRVTGLALLPDGGVAVADGQNDAVRVFSADGELRYSFGREGAGPGELQGPCCLAVDTGGRLWVRDGGNARYNIYRLHDDSTSSAGQVRMAHGDVNRHAPVTFDAGGNVIDIGLRADPGTGQRRVMRMTVDSTGSVLHDVALHTVPDDSTAMKAVQRPTAGGSETRYAYQPFGPQELVTHSPAGEFAHAVSSRYAIDWRAADGSLIRHIARDVRTGPGLSAAERERGEEQMQQQAEFVGVARGQLGFDVPSTKPPLRSLYFDRDGRLWVELAVADGADRTAHVYGTDGALQQVVTWPANVDLRQGAVHGDVAWGVLRGELDVPSVVRLRWQR